VVIARLNVPAQGLWPPLVALTLILVTRKALVGLLAGGFAGAMLLAGGNPWEAYLAVFRDHLAPSLTSPWKVGALAFTLLLGGFAAILEAGGGFTALLRRLAPPGREAGRRFQLAAYSLGLICFFDGLANSLMVGRVGRSLAAPCGVSRVKLAYLVDSTSSAVACVALISTWIAFQLSMIDDALVAVGRDASAYSVFLQSLPYNFYCWFTLILAPAAIWWRFEPGPMGRFESEARQRKQSSAPVAHDTSGSTTARALIPLAALLLAFGAGFLILGRPDPFGPLDRDALTSAFGSDQGPQVMVLASLVAILVAFALFPQTAQGRFGPAVGAFGQGVRTMLGPIVILIAAWILGSVVQALGTAEMIAGLVDGESSAALLPALVFIIGALVSFATGTSWGTMGLLFPLTIPTAAAMSGGLDPAAQDTLLHAVVAAVFSGAVFGDHCSPFSDTTIVTAIACEVEPHDHVRTQLPYALVTAVVAIALGFLPVGFGMPAWIAMVLGGGALILLAWWRGKPIQT